MTHPRFRLRGAPALLLAGLCTPAPGWAGTPQPTAQIQLWTTAYDMDVDPQADPGGYGDPEADIGLSIARTRFGMRGEERRMYWRLTVGNSAPYDTWFAQNNDDPVVGIVDAFIGLRPRVGPGELRLVAGSQRAPFGRENQISSRDLMFQERGVAAEHMSPGRDLGLVADYEMDMGLRVQLSALNGGGDFFGDVDDGLTTSARLEWAHGETYQTWHAEGDNALGIGASLLYDSQLATRTVGMGADLLARFEGFVLLAEVLQATIEPSSGTTVALPEVFEQTGRLGLTGQLGYVLPTAGGSVEIAGRYSHYNDAVALSDAGDVGLIHGGLTYRDSATGLDVGGGYIHRMEHGGSSVPNDTVRLWIQLLYR